MADNHQTIESELVGVVGRAMQKGTVLLERECRDSTGQRGSE